MQPGPPKVGDHPGDPALPLSDAVIRPDSVPDAKDSLALLVEEATEYAVFLLSPAGIVSTWNRGAERIKGYKPEQIIGQHFSVFYTPEDRHAGEPARMIAAALDHGKVATEGWRVRRDGSRFWASVLITALRDGAGRLRGFAKLTRDETDRREHQARELLFTEQERIATVIADGVLSRLFELGLKLSALLEMSSQPEYRNRLQQIVSDTDETISYLRTSVFEAQTIFSPHSNEAAASRALINQLQYALDSRVIVEQAKGFIAASRDIDPNEAFQLLRRYSRNHGQSVQVTAKAVVERRVLP